MIRRPPRSTLSSSSAASDVYKRQAQAMGKAPQDWTAAASARTPSSPMEVAPFQVASVAAQLGIDTGYVWDIYKADKQAYQRIDKLKDAVVEHLRKDGFAPSNNTGEDMVIVCDDATLAQWQQLGNVRAMLQYLDRVIWTNSGWDPLTQSDLCLVDHVKAAFKKALRCVHPDKLPPAAPEGIRGFATRVFDPLKVAYDNFVAAEKMVAAHLEEQGGNTQPTQ
eukprot:TRINITY_DN18669_c0_g1_i2.p1 TRINITY_DN18669_c0_g1~~TRINITY_DN18669_c0_g1_i2.p1  ORF type:complete len:222 (+),score=49.51 TRINITY_DN18669_c0_g1_i2:78-743(+)